MWSRGNSSIPADTGAADEWALEYMGSTCPLLGEPAVVIGSFLPSWDENDPDCPLTAEEATEVALRVQTALKQSSGAVLYLEASRLNVLGYLLLVLSIALLIPLTWWSILFTILLYVGVMFCFWGFWALSRKAKSKLLYAMEQAIRSENADLGMTKNLIFDKEHRPMSGHLIPDIVFFTKG
jgi:hypothetical protein